MGAAPFYFGNTSLQDHNDYVTHRYAASSYRAIAKWLRHMTLTHGCGGSNPPSPVTERNYFTTMDYRHLIKLVESLILFTMLLLLINFAEQDEKPVRLTDSISTDTIYIYQLPIDVTPEQEYTITENLIRVNSQVYDIPPYPGVKKWMGYKSFGRGTKQYKLQQYCITDGFGLRSVDGLYAIAIGSRFGTKIGQRIDLVLENGTVIPCVMGDQKADRHTDATNTFSNTTRNLCCSEFIVDTRMLDNQAAFRGDTSFICDIWQSPVTKIIVYNINILEELEAERYAAENY